VIIGMSKSRKAWIPAGLACLAAILLIAYSYHLQDARHFGTGGPRMPGEPRPDAGDNTLKGFFTTLGTISLYLGALTFSWYWFRKKAKSPSRLVRMSRTLLYAVHKWMGWSLLLLIGIHGAYFVIADWNPDKAYSGLGAFAMLLAIAGYGYLIRTVRNKWMRSAHRWLGVAWVPILLLHAGGSTVIAVLVCLGLFGMVWLLERRIVVAE